MSFGAAKTISQPMTIVRDYDVLILDLGDVPLLGVTAALAVETMIREAFQRHRVVFLIAAEGQVRDRLRRLQLLELLTPERLLTNRLEALKQAVVQVSHEIR